MGPHGLEGDRHAQELHQSRSGEVSQNQRQVTAVSTEEVEVLCAAMGVSVFTPGAMGENLRLSGIMLASLSAGAIIEFESGARLLVTGQNDPCVNAARELSQTYGPDVGLYFVKQAFGRRGILARVLTAGAVRPGDSVRVLDPA